MRGRKPKGSNPVPITVYVPETMAAKLRLLYLDPKRVDGRAKYGALSSLVTQLLHQWLERETGPGAGAAVNVGNDFE